MITYYIKKGTSNYLSLSWFEISKELMEKFILIFALLAISSVSSLTIQSAEVVGSDGREESRPAREGKVKIEWGYHHIC